MNNLYDAKERKKALDPTQSFIVQAPAGSGKTELITQRFLVLLGSVKQPEEILAITFTKKSSAEMRARIIRSLQSAHNDPEPEAEHAKQTWKLASFVLQRNHTLNWNLLENPNRLQIQTIDSFNSGLTRQLPLLSNFGAPLEIADNAFPLYREAVHEFLAHLEEDFTWVRAIETLLLHMDNDLNKVEKLLIAMLAKRDQWLPYIATNANNPELRATLESQLEYIVCDGLSFLHDAFPKEHRQELATLLTFAASQLIPGNYEDTDFPGTQVSDKKTWEAIAKLLLKEDGDWRKSIDKRQGFPIDTKNPEQKKLFVSMKQRMLDLIEQLSPNEKLLQGLRELRILPNPFYEDSQWETLEALHDVLRVVVAQLQIVFQEYGKIDYIQNAQAAYTALGTDEFPTDITLALDYKIQHILIDEFQDTSNSQYRLLNKLIMGWQPDDGRTLFVVGDPMQSIYRFREAEVGLFIRARKMGIANINLVPLTLSVNFRSIPGIVNWVNESFIKILPPFEDIASGAVSFSSSLSSQTQDAKTLPVKLHPFINANETDQSNALIRTIQDIRKNTPHEKIAILVRSRSHLTSIIPMLKAANLPFRALDIEPLAMRPVIQDLLALTRALLNPADRIAWLSILRSPWCGLTLSDLLALAGDKSKAIIIDQLKNSTLLATLSLDGQKRVQRIFSILEGSLSERRRYSMRTWIENTWLLIGGPACVEHQGDLDDAEAFFKLLEELDNAFDLSNIKLLTDAINKLYAAPNNQADDFLQIMTVHNSKGLEFDVVILPHLERKASQDDKQLLQWMERPRKDASSALILAPIHAVGEDTNLIYDFIMTQQKNKSNHENGRLLYVAATRAKKQLHIFFNLKSKETDHSEIKEPTNNSLLQKLWPAIHTDIKANLTNGSPIPQENGDTQTQLRSFKRLVSEWINLPIENKFTERSGYHQKKSGFNLLQNNPKWIGIVIHQILQQISLHGVQWWETQSSFHQRYIQNNLLQLGMQMDTTHDAALLIENSIRTMLNDERGRWIFGNHSEVQAELPLTMIIDGKPKHLVIDRTFVDADETRWIIDYKSAELLDSDLTVFLEAEKKQYENQLWEYHQALQLLDSRPIRVGLYFPLIPAWKEWSYTESVA